jgi:outer membrane immunogenic protein
MRNVINVFLIYALTVGISTSTSAEEKIGWQGPYLGFLAGYSEGSTKVHVDAADPSYFPDFAGGEKMHQNTHGAFGGFETGYNFQDSNFVYGGYLSVAASSAKGDSWSKNACCGPGDDHFTTKINALSQFGAKAGVSIDNSVLIFLKGGLAVGNVNFDLIDANYRAPGDFTPNDSTAHKDKSKVLTGYSVGAGIDFKLTSNVALGFDYTFVDLGNQKWNMTTASYRSNGNYAGQAEYILKTKSLQENLFGLNIKYLF